MFQNQMKLTQDRFKGKKIYIHCTQPKGQQTEPLHETSSVAILLQQQATQKFLKILLESTHEALFPSRKLSYKAGHCLQMVNE